MSDRGEPVGTTPVRSVWRRPQHAGARAVAGLLVTAALLAAGGCNGALEPVSGDVPDLPADQVIEGVRFTITLEGVRQARLLSDSAYVHEDSSAVDLVGVDLRTFDDGGRESAHVTSRTGVLDMRTQAMIARGDARVRTRDGGRVITTEELHYDPEKNQIWSDVATTIVQDGTTTHASRGFRSDTEFRNFEIRGTTTRGGVRF